MKMTFLTPRDEAWDAFLAEVPHDFYHKSSYARLSSEFDGGEAEAVLLTDGLRYFFLPYVVRTLSSIAWLGAGASGLFDITSPYGYPGPLCSAGDNNFASAAAAEWFNALRTRGAVSGFLRLHPLLPAPLEELAKCGSVVERGRTVSIDLSLSAEEMWGQTRADHRRNISKSKRSGLTAAMEDFGANIETFMRLYYETMDRAKASRYYYFPAEYFHSLKACLQDNLALCLVRDAAGEVLGGGLFTLCQGIIQYHLSGTFEAAIPLRPAKLMLDFVRTWAKEDGNRVLHLGGGLGAKEDFLFEFKCGFSTVRHPFHTWQVVFDPDQYHRLAQQRSSQPNAEVDPEFFPLYRA